MTSTRLSELDLTDSRSAQYELRLAQVRTAVRQGTYRAPAERVAEAIIASSRLGFPPDPGTLAWAS